MDFTSFKNKVPYPDHPEKPILPKNPTPADYRAHAEALEAYADAKEKFMAARMAYDIEEGKVNDRAKQAMLEDVGLDKHPKRDKIYAYAWQHGHSGGYNDVWCVLCDIADLFKD